MEVHTPEPFNRNKPLATWKAKLATMTARGFTGPVFSGFVVRLL